MHRAGHPVVRPAARVAAGVTAVLAAVMLTGCGEVRPGAAATVDGEAIPLEQVDEMARAYCAAELIVEEQGGDPRMFETTAGYRERVLVVLVNAELAEGVGAELGLDVPPSAYTADLSQLDEQFADLSETELDALRDYVATFTRMLAFTAAIAQEQGDEEVTQDPQTAIDAGYLVRLADGADIDLDPRFGELRRGRLVDGGASLSVPDDAGDAADPPASQTCA